MSEPIRIDWPIPISIDEVDLSNAYGHETWEGGLRNEIEEEFLVVGNCQQWVGNLISLIEGRWEYYDDFPPMHYLIVLEFLEAEGIVERK